MKTVMKSRILDDQKMMIKKTYNSLFSIKIFRFFSLNFDIISFRDFLQIFFFQNSQTLEVLR